LPDDVWISLIVRDQTLLPATGEVRLEAGDQVILIADPAHHSAVRHFFERRA
jgi:cell volume regulation protein A